MEAEHTVVKRIGVLEGLWTERKKSHFSNCKNNYYDAYLLQWKTGLFDRHFWKAEIAQSV
jgi:hypothetical protein